MATKKCPWIYEEHMYIVHYKTVRQTENEKKKWVNRLNITCRKIIYLFSLGQCRRFTPAEKC